MSKFDRLIVLCVCFFLITSCTSLQESNQDLISDVTSQMKEVFVKGKPSAWVGYNPLDYPVVFVSTKAKTVDVFENGMLQPESFQLWKKKLAATRNNYDFIDRGNKKVLVIYLDNKKLTSRGVLSVLLHEGFHLYKQRAKNWVKSKSAKPRGTIYPLLARPRYLRHEMILSLKGYLEQKDLKHLQAYSWWYNQWRHGVPEEFESHIERTEGSAQYFSKTSLAKLYRGKRSFFDFYVENRPEQNLKTWLSFDRETYLIGFLAGQALDQFTQNKKWQSKVEQGQAPAHVLAESVKPLPQKINHDRQNYFLKLSVREMHRIDKDGKIDSLSKNLSDPRVKRVAIPMLQLKTGSFEPKAFYRSYFNFPGTKDIVFFQLNKKTPFHTKGFTFSLNKDDFWIIAKSTPCFAKEATAIVLLPEGQYKKEAEFIKTKNFHGPVYPIKKKYKNWYCLKAR